jgi:hypothetical protein
VIYPATLAAWAFLMLSTWQLFAALTSVVLFLVGSVTSLRLIRAIEADYQKHCAGQPHLDEAWYYQREPAFGRVSSAR